MALLNRVLLCLLLVGAMLPLCADINVSLGGVACVPAGQGLCTAVTGATTIDFNGMAGNGSPLVSGPAHYTWVPAEGTPFVNGNGPGPCCYAAPPSDTTDYLTVGSGLPMPSDIYITFDVSMSYFGFYMGSPDAYNFITFYGAGDVPIRTFTGDQLLTPAGGDQTVGRFVNFWATSGTTFDKIVMSSDIAAFETDNHAYAAPDGGMTLMLLGSALVGLETLRRRFRA